MGVDRLRYRLLGPLEVTRDGVPIDLGRPKQRAVLAALLLARGRVVSTARLSQVAWGGEPPTSATASLQSYVSNLRRALRAPGDTEPAIVRRTHGYVMTVERRAVDLLEFADLVDRASRAADGAQWEQVEALTARALRLVRGELLEDFGDDDWMRAEAAQVSRRIDECRELRIASLLAERQPTAALALAELLVGSEPMRERANWLRMLALHRSGRTTEALDAYHEHARVLADDLGLSPGPAVRDLYGAILRQDVELEHWPRVPLPPVSEAGVGQSEGTAVERLDQGGGDRGRLVGRRDELELVRRLADSSDRDRPPVWLVLTGPAGIGKTRLAEEAIAMLASPQTRVLRVVCPDDRELPPWWPIRAVIRSLGGDPDRLLNGDTELGADGGRFYVYEQVDALLRTVAEERTIIFADDVQWADDATMGWLSHLVTTREPFPVIWVLTVREDARSPALEQLLDEIARTPHHRQISLSPLNRDEVRELVTAVSGDEIDTDEATTITEQTGGNPFLVGEVARLPRADRAAGGMPLAVRSVLRRRLSGVDGEVMRILRIAAVIGGTLDIDLICTVAGVDRETLRDLLGRAVDDHLIVAGPERASYQFAHGLLRRKILDSLSAPSRQQLHAEVAAAIADPFAPEDFARRATHLAAASPFVSPRAVYKAARLAAGSADSARQHDVAATWWEHARRAYLRLPPADRADSEEDDLVIAEVVALAQAGEPRKVIDIVERHLRATFDRRNWPMVGRLAAVLIRAAGAWPWVSYAADPSGLLELLTGIEAAAAQQPAARARVLGALAIGSYHHPDGELRHTVSRRAVLVAERIGDTDALTDALVARAVALSGVPPYAQEQIEALTRLTQLSRPIPPADAVLRHNLLALTYFGLGRVSEAEHHLRSGIEGSDSLRLGVIRLQLRWMETTFAAWHGEPDRARRLNERAYAMHKQTGLYVPGLQDLAATALGWTAGERAELRPLPDRDPAVLPYAKAALRLVSGVAGARDSVAIALSQESPLVGTTSGELVLLAEAVLFADADEFVTEILQRLLPFAGQLGTFGYVGVLGTVDLAIARLQLRVGDRSGATAHARSALELSERAGGTWSAEHARSLIETISSLPRRGGSRDSR